MINNRNIVKGRIYLVSDLYSPSVDTEKYYEMCESFSKHFSNDEFKASFYNRFGEELFSNGVGYDGYSRAISFTAYKNDSDKRFQDIMMEIFNTDEYKSYIRDIFYKGNDHYPNMIQIVYDEIIGDDIYIANGFYVNYKHHTGSSTAQNYEGKKFDCKTTPLEELNYALLIHRCSYDMIFLLETFSKGENYAER